MDRERRGLLRKIVKEVAVAAKRVRHETNSEKVETPQTEEVNVVLVARAVLAACVVVSALAERRRRAQGQAAGRSPCRAVRRPCRLRGLATLEATLAYGVSRQTPLQVPVRSKRQSQF
jgi:hypothetical protein